MLPPGRRATLARHLATLAATMLRPRPPPTALSLSLLPVEAEEAEVCVVRVEVEGGGGGYEVLNLGVEGAGEEGRFTRSQPGPAFHRRDDFAGQKRLLA